MKQSTKRVVGWGTGLGVGVALLVLVAVMIMMMTAQPAARDETTGLDAVQTEAGEARPVDEVVCNYPEEWIGKPVDEEAVKDVAKAYRILGPNSMATMDYSPDRLNVRTDEDGIVLEVTCG